MDVLAIVIPLLAMSTTEHRITEHSCPESSGYPKLEASGLFAVFFFFFVFFFCFFCFVFFAHCYARAARIFGTVFFSFRSVPPR